MKKPPQTTIHLGFEVGTGEPVGVPLRHLAVTGQTQESGKTTTLEALITRSNLRAIAFKTKRGEASFAGGNACPPYFQDAASAGRPYWEFVEELVASTMKQKMKFERAWIVRAAEGAVSLARVRSNLTRLQIEAKRGMDRDIFMLLGEYLDIVVPQVESLPRSDRIDLKPGLNVMDLTAYTEEMQMLIIRSVVQWVHERESGVVTVMPEAWKMIPEARMTPVKPAAERLVREGAGLKNFVWMDSQDIAGIWKLMLRAATVWIVGVQREQNEVKRTLANIPDDTEKPKAAQVMKLRLGEFFVCHGATIKHVYVQPAWMAEADARRVARGEASISDFQRPETAAPETTARTVSPSQKEKGVPMIDPALAAAIEKLAGAVNDMRTEIGKLNGTPRSVTVTPSVNVEAPAVDVDAIVSEVLARLPASGGAGGVALSVGVPQLEVSKKRHLVKLDDSTTKGRVALLLAEGFFSNKKNAGQVSAEMKERGHDEPKSTVRDALDSLTQMGFFRKTYETNGANYYKAVEGMEVNLVDV